MLIFIYLLTECIVGIYVKKVKASGRLSQLHTDYWDQTFNLAY